MGMGNNKITAVCLFYCGAYRKRKRKKNYNFLIVRKISSNFFKRKRNMQFINQNCLLSGS